MELVLVEWEDSMQPFAGWAMLDDLPELRIAKCQSVGWIVAENEQVLMLAPNIADIDTNPGQGSGFIRIPQRSIVSRRKLKSLNSK